MKKLAHIRASVRRTKNGYAATLHVKEMESGMEYRNRLKIERMTPKDAIYDGMEEARTWAAQNGCRFKPTYANAGDVYAA